MKKLFVFSLALFGSYHTHATLPSTSLGDLPSEREPNKRVVEDVDPRDDLCLSEEEKRVATKLLIALGKSPASVETAIEEFGRLCRPR